MAFTARWRGWCPVCDEEIRPGQTVEYSDPYASEGKRLRHAPSCFLIHPEGACDR